MFHPIKSPPRKQWHTPPALQLNGSPYRKGHSPPRVLERVPLGLCALFHHSIYTIQSLCLPSLHRHHSRGTMVSPVSSLSRTLPLTGKVPLRLRGFSADLRENHPMSPLSLCVCFVRPIPSRSLACIQSHGLDIGSAYAKRAPRS